ncbi:hypothetical protein BC830DRAFT_1146437 [Chytriomyces sp. MP71]|nr:hypothetical protein BC830DRAFT_1146437 [Chytriomyces sp. MP71]
MPSSVRKSYRGGQHSLKLGSLRLTKWEFFLLTPWKRIVWFFLQDLTMIERLRLVSMEFRTICSNPELRAAYFLEMSCKHLVLNHVYSKFPYALTSDVVAVLVQKGALVPKYFVERVHSEQVALIADQSFADATDTDSTRSSKNATPPINRSTLETLVAMAETRYPQSLLLDAPLEQGTTAPKNNVAWTIEMNEETDTSVVVRHDDAWLVKRGLESPSSYIHLTGLKKALFDHHFTPALAPPPATPADWDDFWAQLLALLRIEPDAAHHIIKHTALSSDQVNDSLVARTIRDFHLSFITPTSMDGTTDFFLKHGLKLTEGAVLVILTNAASVGVEAKAAVERLLETLRLLLPAPTLATYALKAIGILFRDGSLAALQSIDILLDGFLFSTEAVGSVFLANPIRVGEKEEEQPLPFLTAHGQSQGGMTDPLWQLISQRFGANHPFTAACLVDTVIGGTLTTPISQNNTSSRLLRSYKSPDYNTLDQQDDRVAVVTRDGSIRLKRQWDRTRAEMRAKRQAARLNALERQLDFLYAKAGPRQAPVFLEQVNELFEQVLGDVEVLAGGKAVMGNDERRRDLAGRDTIESMVEAAKVPLDAGMVGPIAKAVIVLKYAKGRVIDVMARVERKLVDVICFPDGLSPKDLHDWSKERWILALRQHVLENRAFLDHTLSEDQIWELEREQKRRDRSKGAKAKRISAGIFSNPIFGTVLQQGDRANIPSPDSPSPTSPATARSSVLGSIGRSLSSLVRTQTKTVAEQPILSSEQKKHMDFQNPSEAAAVARDTALQFYGKALTAAASAVDFVDPEYADIRRFYSCCEDLAALLNAADPFKMEAILNGHLEAPFTAWLGELERTAAAAEVDADRAEAGLAPIPRPSRLSRLANAVTSLPGSVAGWVWKEEDENNVEEEGPMSPKSTNRLSYLSAIPGSVTGWVKNAAGGLTTITEGEPVVDPARERERIREERESVRAQREEARERERQMLVREKSERLSGGRA